MAIPASKKELLEALDTEYKNLVTELKSVPSALVDEKTIEGGLSPHNLLSYQIGWGNLLLGWYKSGIAKKLHELPAKGFKWNRLGELAEHFYRSYEKKSFEKLLIDFEKLYQSLRMLIEENNNKQLYSLHVYNWTGDKWPLGRWINVNTSSPYKSACAKIRKWKKEKGL